MDTTANDLDKFAAYAAGWDTDPSEPVEVAFNIDKTGEADVIAMDEDNGTHSIHEDKYQSEQVALVSNDGFQVWCSKSEVMKHSGKLSEMISDQQDSGGRIHLPVSYSEALLLARGIDADISGWNCYTLENLIRTANLFCSYDLRRWHIGLETAIIDRLEQPDEGDGPSPMLRDQRFADKLVYTAQQGSMYRLWSFIDKQGLCSATHYDPGDDRPRKRRKVSTEWVHQCIECS